LRFAWPVWLECHGMDKSPMADEDCLVLLLVFEEH